MKKYSGSEGLKGSTFYRFLIWEIIPLNFILDDPSNIRKPLKEILRATFESIPINTRRRFNINTTSYQGWNDVVCLPGKYISHNLFSISFSRFVFSYSLIYFWVMFWQRPSSLSKTYSTSSFKTNISRTFLDGGLCLFYNWFLLFLWGRL